MKYTLLITSIAACVIGCVPEGISKPAASHTQQHLDVSIDTDKSIGVNHRFWTVRVLTHQDRFTNPNFLDKFRATHPFSETINCVRILGGRTDNLNQWYQGMNPDGTIKTDFTELMPRLRALLDVGFKPGIVLDNVPHAMSKDRVMHKYGNSNAPDDFNVWHAYITAFVNALVAEFGMDEVQTWRYRVGTEPDLFPGHWVGTREQYYEHYAVTVDALTRIIPNADIGPGNILNPAKPPPGSKRKKTTMQLTGDGKGWGVTMIDHLAKEKPHATFFAISHYSHVNEPIQLEESVRRVRERLDLFPEISDIPLEIHESGILADENKRRINGNDGSEWGASWYAAIADIAYRENIREIYDWGYTAADVPTPRQLVIEMLDTMAGGERLALRANGDGVGKSGVIAVRKDTSIFLLLYNHQAPRESNVQQSMTINLQGEAILASTQWAWDEWTVDKRHGAWIHEFYRDCEAAGVEVLPDAPHLGIHFHQRYSDGWREVLKENLGKYHTLARLQKTSTMQPISSTDGTLMLNFELPAHTVKLIELKAVETPVAQEKQEAQETQSSSASRIMRPRL